MVLRLGFGLALAAFRSVYVCVELRHNDLSQGRGGQRGWIGESRGKAGHP